MIRRVVSLVIGAAIMAAAVWYMMTPEVLEDLRIVVATASWRLLLAALVLSAGIQWLRAWRFSIMTNGGFALPRWSLVRIACQLNFFNYVLPFRLGELSYPVMMKRTYGHSMLHAAGVLVLLRIVDLCTVGAILLASLAVLDLAGGSIGSLALGAVAAGLAVLPVVGMLGARSARSLLRLLPPGSRLAARLEVAFTALGERRPQLASVGLSFAIWLTFGAVAALAAGAVAIGVRPAVLLFGVSASNLAFALPINGIAGLGASQAAWVTALNHAGVPWNDAVITALSFYVVTLVSALLLGGLALLAGTWKPAPRLEAEPSGQSPATDR